MLLSMMLLLMQLTVDVYRIQIVGPLPATTVAWEGNLPALSVRCGVRRLNAEVPSTVVNPTTLRWSDPSDPMLECVYRDDEMSGPISRLTPSETNTYQINVSGRSSTGWLPIGSSVNTFIRRGQTPTESLSNIRIVK